MPWIPRDGVTVQGLTLRQGPNPVLRYLDVPEDQITLRVNLLDPHQAPQELAMATRSVGPGAVTLVAGHVPLEHRWELRQRMVSFLDVDGTAEIFWPRLRISASRLTDATVERNTPAVTLRGSRARITQTLLSAHLSGKPGFKSATALALGAASNPSTVSRLLADLQSHGLIRLHRDGTAHSPEVTDQLALATLLRDERGWPSGAVAHGYVFGRDGRDRGARITATAADSRLGPTQTGPMDVAITGRIAAESLGILATGPSVLRVWVKDPGVRSLSVLLQSIGVEPAPSEEANCVVAVDRDGIGTHQASKRQTADGQPIRIAHPVRVWCDLATERRGESIAAQLWPQLLDRQMTHDE